ncbi:MAG TPA: hypothetical protein VE288_03815 [Rubrobacteraceae bacterium]|nr:hypothetical protein [Rubrobacteraceae bacterium]
MLGRKWMLPAVMLAMVLGIAVPALAQVSPPPQTTLFIPPQSIDAGGHKYTVDPPGGTVACSGEPYTAPSGTCAPLGNRMPDPGLACDVPVRFLAFGILPLSAFACHTASAPETTPASTGTTPASTGTTPTSTDPDVVNRQFVTTDDPNSFNIVTFR